MATADLVVLLGAPWLHGSVKCQFYFMLFLAMGQIGASTDSVCPRLSITPLLSILPFSPFSSASSANGSWRCMDPCQDNQGCLFECAQQLPSSSWSDFCTDSVRLTGLLGTSNMQSSSSWHT
ncbi:uncharacterized protein GGS22DRAFT_6980 [Annulohypoxylon maeteangense]|uniref:uncharacterized protein n=1 Tax=Annulohypoxylon maeteangense TaxID=1927788 RepID=UPI0020088BE5|nr:uncharacterized protein GGS22DRAFT_6980 [Annulohypoxylon maeteangense]KAI0889998.1 hypothetical protein GGS22DRAFT_6980 [Annulohypoxylon maeteangense]